MAKYKVLVIGLSVKNNKIAKCNEVVDDSQLNSSAYELIKGGYIELIEAEVEAEVEAEDLEVIIEEVKPPVKKAVKPILKK